VSKSDAHEAAAGLSNSDLAPTCDDAEAALYEADQLTPRPGTQRAAPQSLCPAVNDPAEDIATAGFFFGNDHNHHAAPSLAQVEVSVFRVRAFAVAVWVHECASVPM
jgi:hypothetical protein